MAADCMRGPSLHYLTGGVPVTFVYLCLPARCPCSAVLTRLCQGLQVGEVPCETTQPLCCKQQACRQLLGTAYSLAG